MRGDRARARELLKLRAESRDVTTFAGANDAISAGWHENVVVREGEKDTLRDVYMRQLMHQRTALEEPDVPYSGAPARPICTTSLKR
jgi:hypothetical protein